MTNISTLCLNFIVLNKTIFNLKQYDVDHSMNVEVLNSYIDCDTFIQQYTSNITGLNEKIKYICNII